VLEWKSRRRQPRSLSSNGNVPVSIRGSVSSSPNMHRPSDVDGSLQLYVPQQYLCVPQRHLYVPATTLCSDNVPVSIRGSLSNSPNMHWPSDVDGSIDDGLSGCSGISWTICKQSAPRSRQITKQTDHHWIFIGWMLFLIPTNTVKTLKAQKWKNYKQNLEDSKDSTDSFNELLPSGGRQQQLTPQ